MQNFTGTGFSNEEIKKEDIVKQIRSIEDAMNVVRDMHTLFLKFGRASMEKGGYLAALDKNREFYHSAESKKAEQEANRLEKEFVKQRTQIIEYLRDIPTHDFERPPKYD